MNIRFAFIGEGTSDNALVAIIESILIEKGANEAIGIMPDWRRMNPNPGRSLTPRIQAVAKSEPGINLLFLHRDADSRDSSARYQEITQAMVDSEVAHPFVHVIPVQETESWLLWNEPSIRYAAGNPNGEMKLNLPTPNNVENVANPKERLLTALLKASGQTGRKLEKLKSRSAEMNNLLFSAIDIHGNINNIPSWKRFVDNINNMMTMLLM